MFGRHHGLRGHDRWGHEEEPGCGGRGRFRDFAGRGRWGGGGGPGWGDREEGGFGGRFGGGPFGGGRMFGHGGLKLLLLSLIAEKPSHGYELIRAIEDKFSGAYAPSPGAVYPTLTLLEEQDYVRVEEAGGSKKLYTITPQGEAYLKENEIAVQGMRARMDMAASVLSERSTPEIVRESIHMLKQALQMHRGPWSAAETDRVRGLIEKAAREIVVGGGQDA